MEQISRISDTTKARTCTGGAPGACWCGQALDRVRGAHCPRCGTARATRVEEVLPRLAA